MTTAVQLLNEARSHIGTHESPNHSNRTPFGEWYGFNGVSWCNIFVSYCFGQQGALELIGGKHAYTPDQADWFKRHGRWSKTPRPGALVFFDWPDQEHRIQHVGLVEAVLPGGKIQTIEGNIGDDRDVEGVWRRVRTTAFVAGYGMPAYSAARPPARGGVHKVPVKRNPITRILTRRKPAPRFPLGKGFYFGPRYPLSNDNSVSGYYSPKQRAALRTVQRRLRLLGFHAVRVTGRYDDSGMGSAVKAFQKAHHLLPDGHVGPVTWAAMFR